MIARSALNDLDAALAASQGQDVLPAPELSALQQAALFGASQILPLRQPGADLIAEGQVFSDCEGCPEMVVVQPGYFLLGSPAFEEDRYLHVFSRPPIRRQLKFANREGPRRLVHIARPLAFSRYEVTFDQWQQAQDDPDWQAITGRPPYMPALGEDYRGDQPALQLDWQDAQALAAYLSAKTGQTYRLPTDAEWEYAARAGTVTRYPWGNEIGQNNAACIGCWDAFGDTRISAVGQFPANGFGLHDMNGNGYEWVEDCFEPYHDAVKESAAPHVPDENCEFRTIRGGGALDIAPSARSAFRVGPHYYNRDEGFAIRLVREMASPAN
ncbi:formylglycine-generating enzyme family protein [Ruegeria sp.]|uniref:formylglycine-generating enzyme family protein n=1 Tax=Ruegeria sp. TaxID=1879320 RepID=UPI003B58ED0D